MVEVEARDGLRVGGIEGGCLLEVEQQVGVEGRLVPGRRAGGSEWWRRDRKPESLPRT
jgi:hypothetical protein